MRAKVGGEVDDLATPSAEPFKPTVRPRIVERLQRAAEYPVSVLVAPAGLGKSVAVRQFLEASGRDHLCFAVQPEHASLLSFAHGFILATSPENVSAVDIAFANTRSSAKQATELAAWAAVILEGTEAVIFIDDLQKAHKDPSVDRDVSTFVATLVAKTKAHVKWVIATRDPLELPLAAWLADGVSDIPIDELELVLTRDESHAIAESLKGLPGTTDVDLILSRAAGLPFAFSMALSVGQDGSNAFLSADAAKKQINRFLNEQVFESLDVGTRSLLVKTALFREVSEEAFALASQVDARECVAELRRRSFCLNHDGKGTWYHHDLFQEFLEERLRAQGEVAFAEAYRLARETFERTRRYDRALDLAAECRDQRTLLRLLDEHGRMLLEQGNAAVLDRALNALDEASVGESAAAQYILANLAVLRGDFDAALSRFHSAAEAAHDRPALQAQIYISHASALGNMHRSDEAEELFKKMSGMRTGDANIDLRIRLQIAAARTMDGIADVNPDDVAYFRRALSRAEDNLSRSRILFGLTVLMEYSCAFEQVRTYALELLHIAEAERLYRMAAGACCALYRAAFESGENDEALAWLIRWGYYAERTGDRNLLSWTLMGQFWLQAEAGDAAAAALTERRLTEVGMLSPFVATAEYAPGYLLRLAGDGRFDEAAQWLTDWLERAPWRPCGVRETDYHHRAQCAFLFCNGWLHSRARDLLTGGGEPFGPSAFPRPRYEGHLWSALACAALEEADRARELLELVERRQDELLRRTVRLRQPVDDLCKAKVDGTPLDGERFERSCSDLRANSLGGYARLFESLRPLFERRRS
ncbi:MAG TPA: hypothetical protein VME66_03115 [Candidatus Acidoferrales bacterium]|nr:hypothetical protein [Candidatus Acidoferrales bacterium]